MPDNVAYSMSLNDLLTPKLEQAEEKAQSFEKSLTNIGVTANKIGIAIAGAFVLTGITMFAKKVIEAGTTIEDAQTGLTTLLKSQAEAADVIKNVQKDAQETPFEFKGLLAANKALISAGASAAEARINVLNLANAVAATGGHDFELERMVVNMQQIRNTGKATALDIRQFATAGINIFKLLADATGKPINQIKGMEVSYDLLTKALAKAHAAGGEYANGLENMSKNTSVSISNLGDAVFNFAGVVFKDFKPAIDGTISGLNNMVIKGAELYQWAKESLPGAIRTTHIVLRELIFDLKAVAIGITAGAVAYAIAYPQTLLYVGATIANTVATGALTIATYAMTAAQWLLNVALDANPIGLIVIAISGLVTGLVLAYKHSSTFRAVISGITQIAKDMIPIFKGLGDVIAGVFTFDPSQIMKGFNEIATGVKNTNFQRSFTKGVQDSLNEDRREEAQENKSTIKATQAKATYKPKVATSTTSTASSKASKVSGTKQVNIHITIGSLIKEFKLTTATIKESPGKIHDVVTQVLLQAVNDTTVTAGV